MSIKYVEVIHLDDRTKIFVCGGWSQVQSGMFAELKESVFCVYMLLRAVLVVFFLCVLLFSGGKSKPLKSANNEPQSRAILF